MLLYILSFALGASVGIAMTVVLVHKKPKTVGTLKMDKTTGDPLMFLELRTPVEDVLKMETVTFDVSREYHI